MASTTPRPPTPEERELAAKKSELAALESRLGQRELDFATASLEWRAFERRYLRLVGVKFAEIDHLEAQMAAALSLRHPGDEPARRRAAEARARAQVTAGTTRVTEPIDQASDAEPAEDVKSLYRQIAKRAHPDLTTDDSERAVRTTVMAEANRAYAEGAGARLRGILTEWDTSPAVVPGEGVGPQLVRTIRQLHQVATRLAALEAAIGTLTDSSLARLKVRFDAERMRGRDLLAEMASQLETHLRFLRRRRVGVGGHEAAP